MFKKLASTILRVISVAVIISSQLNYAEGQEPKSAPTPAVKPIVLSFATHQNPGTAQGETANWLANEIGNRSSGRIKMEVYWGESLAKTMEIIDAISRGVADAGHVPTIYFPSQIPAWSLSDACPFKINEYVTMKVWDEFVNKFSVPLEKELARLNLKAIGYQSCDQIESLHIKKRVQYLEQLKGMKISAWGRYVPVWMRALGIVPLSLPATERVDAFHKGVMDALYSSYATARSYGYFELAPWVTIFPMSGANLNGVVVMNLDKFNKLPNDLQKIILTVGKQWGHKLNELYWKDLPNIFQKCDKLKVQWVELAPGELEKFAALPQLNETMNTAINTLEKAGYPGKEMVEWFYKRACYQPGQKIESFYFKAWAEYHKSGVILSPPVSK